jgi:hypothetical protein
MCNGRWRVRNPNNQPVVFTWDFYQTPKRGAGIVPANQDVLFTTSPGSRTMRLFVGNMLQSTKASSLSHCTGAIPPISGAIAGTGTWSNQNTQFTFQPTSPLLPGQVYSVFFAITDPFFSQFTTVDNNLKISSVTPSSIKNDQNQIITIDGTGFTDDSAFFLQSNQLEVLRIANNQAQLRIPAGFLPSTYGLMVVNLNGSRATLYPAFNILPGKEPKKYDIEPTALNFIQGYVIDYDTKKGIGDATVTLSFKTFTTTSEINAKLMVKTFPSGYFLIRGVPPGEHHLRIEALGYEPVYRNATVTTNGATEGQTVSVKLAELEPVAQQVSYIGSAGGTHYASNRGEDGPFLKIPAGALDTTTQIQFTHLRDGNTLPELPENGYYLAFAHLGPTGLVFKKPATLFLPLQDGFTAPVGTPIDISYFDAREVKWVDDITKGKITKINDKLFLEYEINHFTWIGGRWSSWDTVEGCVKYRYNDPMLDTNPPPAVNIMTNWGVTDSNGIFRGTVPRSESPRPLSAYVLVDSQSASFSGSTSAPVRTTYTPGTSVVFPNCITITPNPITTDTSVTVGTAPYMKPLGFDLRSPGQVGAFGVLAPKPKPQAHPAVKPQAFPVQKPILLMRTDEFSGFFTSIENADGMNASSVRVYLGTDDVTAQSTITYNPPTPNAAQLCRDYNLTGDDCPYKRTASIDVRLELDKELEPRNNMQMKVTAAGLEEVEITELPAKVVVPKPYIMYWKEMPYYYSVPQVLNLEAAIVFMYRKAEDLAGSEIKIPAMAVDKNNKLFPVYPDVDLFFENTLVDNDFVSFSASKMKYPQKY